jgi:hypothetical protein
LLGTDSEPNPETAIVKEPKKTPKVYKSICSGSPGETYAYAHIYHFFLTSALALIGKPKVAILDELVTHRC